jgi:ERCC4-related helicase
MMTYNGNVDEAHKGRGNYAYAQIIRELMHKNPHFRVLALTATPGSKPDDVQELCDALHVSHIEIRDEHSPDLKQYLFDKVFPLFLLASRPKCFVDLQFPHHLGHRTAYRPNE